MVRVVVNMPTVTIASRPKSVRERERERERSLLSLVRVPHGQDMLGRSSKLNELVGGGLFNEYR